jgi:hypothetical protein
VNETPDGKLNGNKGAQGAGTAATPSSGTRGANDSGKRSPARSATPGDRDQANRNRLNHYDWFKSLSSDSQQIILNGFHNRP